MLLRPTVAVATPAAREERGGGVVTPTAGVSHVEPVAPVRPIIARRGTATSDRAASSIGLEPPELGEAATLLVGSTNGRAPVRQTRPLPPRAEVNGE